MRWQEFHARRFLENDVLKHFGIATVEQQRDAVAVFRQLSDKLFDKGTRVRRIEPYTPFPFQGQSVHVPVIHDFAVGHNGRIGAQGSRSNLPNAFNTSFRVYHSSDERTDFSNRVFISTPLLRFIFLVLVPIFPYFTPLQPLVSFP